MTVAISATTTFLTVRQSAKRGLMQTSVDPDNPMAQSQKYMQYIVPFFSLTGLYWQYGLVLYWVTTNLWTLGQQYFMFRNWEPITVNVTATGPAAPRRPRPSSSVAKTVAAGTRPTSGGGAARTASGTGAAKTTAGTGAAKTTAGSPAKTTAGSTTAGGAAKRRQLQVRGPGRERATGVDRGRVRRGANGSSGSSGAAKLGYRVRSCADGERQPRRGR